jgi:hypothetical protein
MPLITSLYGRLLGLDENGALVQNQRRTGTRLQGTSDSTGTKLANNGIVSVVTTTNDTWQLNEAYPGARVTLMTGSSSTGIHSINLVSSVCYSTIGIAGSTVVLTGAGAAVTLLGLSTSIWQLISKAGSSDSNYVSS